MTITEERANEIAQHTHTTAVMMTSETAVFLDSMGNILECVDQEKAILVPVDFQRLRDILLKSDIRKILILLTLRTVAQS